MSREILESQNVKRRIEKICHFIDIAQLCYEYRNFFGLKSILAGLQCTPVHRLSKTWQVRIDAWAPCHHHHTLLTRPPQGVNKKSRATFDKLSTLMSSENNFAAYRRQLAASSPPCIPYLGLCLSDLVYLLEIDKQSSEADVQQKVRFSRRTFFFFRGERLNVRARDRLTAYSPTFLSISRSRSSLSK